MESRPLSRHVEFNGVRLPDIDEKLAPAEIRTLYSHQDSADRGQFILSEPLNERNRRARLRLRTAAELFPEIVDPTLDDDGQPSCSATAALERQELFINSTLAQHALALLERLFRNGEIGYHDGFINLPTGAASAIRIGPRYWKRTRGVGQHYSRRRQG